MWKSCRHVLTKWIRGYAVTEYPRIRVSAYPLIFWVCFKVTGYSAVKPKRRSKERLSDACEKRL